MANYSTFKNNENNVVKSEHGKGSPIYLDYVAFNLTVPIISLPSLKPHMTSLVGGGSSKFVRSCRCWQAGYVMPNAEWVDKVAN
ncbi:unnamed protein product [Dovyalis caffra]|uniref:Uncharacterized protein n=1 Tax=Dovyalis caffra TaxID=77055 RepID=A0AAV1R6S9_9ROSI|nr:unnamed protein product [Dovyalis caffra]